MTNNNKARTLSRRQFVEIATSYGGRAALAGASFAAATGVLPGTRLLLGEASAAGSAKYKVRFGAGVVSPASENHLVTGVYNFVKRVEEASDGEVEFQVIDSGQACGENSCGERVALGVIDMGSSSPQNLGAAFPYSIAMDFPFLWQNRSGYHNFMFSPESDALYRGVLRKLYGVEPLWISGEMRNIFLGLKYANADAIQNAADFEGAKIRITNSIMIANFVKSIKSNPIPLAWGETLEGLKSGVVDGAETWPGAATGFGMHKVLSHDVPLEFCPGAELIYMSAEKLDSFPDRIKEIFYVAARDSMEEAYRGVDLSRDRYIGNGANPAADSAYEESGMRIAQLSDDQLAEFRRLADIERNAELYGSVRKTLDELAGLDVYGAFKEQATRWRDKPLTPQAWWS